MQADVLVEKTARLIYEALLAPRPDSSEKIANAFVGIKFDEAVMDRITERSRREVSEQINQKRSQVHAQTLDRLVDFIRERNKKVSAPDIAGILRENLEQFGMPVAYADIAGPANRIVGVINARFVIASDGPMRGPERGNLNHEIASSSRRGATPRNDGGIDEPLFTEAEVSTARNLFDAVQTISETTVVEYRFVDSDLARMSDPTVVIGKFLEVARSELRINPNMVVRIIVPDRLRSELRKLRTMKDDPNRYILEGRQLLIVSRTRTNYLQFMQAPASITISSETIQNELRFDSNRYGDGSSVSYEGDDNEEVAAQIFAAALVALTKRTVDWLARYDNGLIRAQSRKALSATTLLIYMILQQAEGARRAAQSA